MFPIYPYLNLNDLNLDYILKKIKEMQTELKDFVATNAIKYADPIQWNITTQYEKNTVVIDPLTGTAYLSVQPVPSGVSLANTDYWTVVFDLSMFITKAAQNFTNHYEPETTTTATFASAIGDWLVWGDVLYHVISPITAGDQYVEGSNILHFTIEDLSGHLEDLVTYDKTSIVNAINSLHDTIFTIIGDLDDLNTLDKTSVVNAINSALDMLNTTIGDLDNLVTYDKTSVVNAINSLHDTIFTIIGDLNDLTTSDKTSVVYAINDVNFRLNNLIDRRFVLIGDSYLEGANHHPDDTWTYDIKSWGAYLDDYLGQTTQKVAVGGAGIGGEIYDSWLNVWNNTTITDPDTVTDVIVGGSANDIGLTCTLSDMLNGASDLAAAIKTKCPNARLWIADIGISINATNDLQTQLVRTVYTWFGQFGYHVMCGTQNVLRATDRVQWDGVHPTNLGQMFIALAMYNNLLSLTYNDYKNGFSTNSYGIDLLFTNVDGNAFVNKIGNDVIVFDPVLTGTFSGLAGVSVDLGAVDSDYWSTQTTTHNINSVPGFAYIGADLYPAVMQFAFLNGHFYMFPIVIQGASYYTGNIATLIIPSFSLTFPKTYI